MSIVKVCNDVPANVSTGVVSCCVETSEAAFVDVEVNDVGVTVVDSEAVLLTPSAVDTPCDVLDKAAIVCKVDVVASSTTVEMKPVAVSPPDVVAFVAVNKAVDTVCSKLVEDISVDAVVCCVEIVDAAFVELRGLEV
jgi:hypothetical protein